MLTKTLFFFLISFQSAWGITAVYFENNSASNFEVAIQQSGTHILNLNEWNQSVDSIRAWEGQSELMWTNRNTGIHNGDDFYFDIKFKQGTDSFSLKIKLRGTFSSSNLWIAASGIGFSHPWYGDNNFHQADFTIGGRPYRLKYHAYFTGGYDDVFFALQDLDPYPVLVSDTLNASVLNVLAYNIYMLTPPIALTDQMDRANEIAKHVKGYDVIVLSEAFYNSARNTLQATLAAEYPYISAVVDNGVLNDDGGVFVASRFPILSSAQMVYDDCNGTDCLAAKGVMYVKINKLGRHYHLFGTHTQAWNSAADVATRILQFKELYQFIQSQNIPSNEAVLVGGDLNVDKILNNLGEYDGLLDSLQLKEPLYTGHPYTYDGDISYYASPGYEFLDYIMASNEYLVPDSSSNRVIILRSIADNLFNTFDLSDHLAVQGRFVYAPIVSKQANLKVPEYQFILYPNPSNGVFQLDVGTSLQLVYRVYSPLGHLVLEGQSEEGNMLQFDLRGQVPGIYYLSTLVQGQVVFSTTLMVTEL